MLPTHYYTLQYNITKSSKKKACLDLHKEKLNMKTYHIIDPESEEVNECTDKI